MRFLIDMPLSPGLAHWLSGQGHDAVHASALMLSRAPDTEIVARAKSERRTVITAELDFPGCVLERGIRAQPDPVLRRQLEQSRRGRPVAVDPGFDCG